MSVTPKRLFFIISMLWLAGVATRVPILAIPPLIPFIRTELHMSGTEIGALSGIPLILLAFGALPGSALVDWLGARRALLIGLLIAGIGSILRGFASTTIYLFAATTVMGIGIAIPQPALPVMVRQWLPSRIALGTAAYSNGIIAGCIFPVAMTLTLIMPALNNSWQLDLIFWSMPVFMTLIFIAVAAPRSHDPPRPAELRTRFLWGIDYRGPRIIAVASNPEHLWSEQHGIKTRTKRNHSRTNSGRLTIGGNYSRSPTVLFGASG